MRFLYVLLIIAYLAACATNKPLGEIEQGMYHQPKGWFTCPLPANQLKFASELDIEDAYFKQEMEVRYNHETRRNEKMPVGIGEWVPSHKVIIRDALNEDIEIEWLFGRIPDNSSEQKSIRSRRAHTASSLLFSADNEFSISGYRAYAWLSQIPYLPSGIEYGGGVTNETFIMSNRSSPNIQFYLNLVSDGHFIWVTATQPSKPYLNASTNSKNLDAVLQDLVSQPKAMEDLFKSYINYFKQCTFNTPYRE